MAPGDRLRDISRRRYLLFAAVAITLGLAVGFAALEAGLGYLRKRIESSDRVDRGMMIYDATLGWRPSPGWSGRHSNYDFEVAYRINAFGFRGAFDEALAPHKTRRIGVLGDSVTFGLGANEGETFVDRMQERAAPHEAVFNLAIPGYSTDQQLLLAERVLPARFRPTELLLVVYLANDLIDNMRPYPIQGPQGKPYFQATAGGLSLRNVPVPLKPKPAGHRAPNLSALALTGLPQPGRLERMIGELEVLRRLGIVWPQPTKLFPAAAEKVRPSVELFVTLAARLRIMAARRGVPLRLVLLPGRSFFAAPESHSGQYQDHVRREIVARAAAIGAPILDLGATLRAKPGAARAAALYYRNDGHLTVEGNGMVGGILADALRLGGEF